MTGPGQTDCSTVPAALLEHVFGAAIELDADTRTHLSGCARCQAEYDALREAYELLPPSSPARPPAFLRERVRSYARESVETGLRRQPARGLVRSNWRLATVGAGLAVAATLAIVMTKSATIPSGVDPSELAPMFEALDVSTGAMRSFGEFEGKAVLLNFWATWCLPCESEMASMERLYRQFRDDGLVVVAVSVDRESRFKVQQWVERRGVTFPVFQDVGGRVERLYRTIGVPESFVIDRAGAIVMRAPGPRVWDDPEHSALVRDLLRTDGPR